MNLKIILAITTFILIGILANDKRAQNTTVNYTYSTDDFVNPERGWYRYSETRSGSYTPLDSAQIAGYRLLHTPFSAGYSIYSSLVFRYFFLEDFKTSPISAAYLSGIEQDFATARAAGVKLIPRFAYTDQVNNSCGSSFCPPYGDASKAIILQHIEQLKPILQKNYDVILSLQMGFIGIWGENYYTDFFGDASQAPYTLTSNNWADRKEVLDSLLNALPENRNVQVRYPQMKQKTVYGINAPITSAPLTIGEAFSGLDKARIGFHNDCFLASADDFGTYNDYDNAVSDTSILKPYKALDSKFVYSGGETCFASSFSTCDSQGGNVLKDMARLHYSYLNADYNNTVNDSWIGDCLDSVKTSLGYRLALVNATFDNSVSVGASFSCDMNIKNLGFSAPINERNVILVLINNSNQEQWEYKMDVDPRYWFRGTHSFSSMICVPDCMPPGTYHLYLKLSDPAPKITNKILYNIRLANQNIWDSATGLNDLDHHIVITSGTGSCSPSDQLKRYNYWVGPTTGNWHDSSSNWSLDKIPDFCDDVVIPVENEVTISNGLIGNAHSILIQGNSRLILIDGSTLEIQE
jgi:hypothetical protein